MKIIKKIFRWGFSLLGWLFVLAALNGVLRYDSVFDPITSPNFIINIIVIFIFFAIGIAIITKNKKKK